MNKGLVIGLVVLLIAASSVIYITKNQASEDKLYIIGSSGPVNELPIEGSIRQAWYDALFNQSSANLLYNIEVGIKNKSENKDHLKTDFIIGALSYVIIKEKNPSKTYAKIEKMIIEKDDHLASVLIEVLGDVPTKESLDILISLVGSNKLEKDKESNIIGTNLRYVLYKSITGMVEETTYDEELGGYVLPFWLSPQLEKAWKELKISDKVVLGDNSDYSGLVSPLFAYTIAIIKLGTSSGMELMFDALKSQSITIRYDKKDYEEEVYKDYYYTTILVNNVSFEELKEVDAANYKASVVVSVLGEFANPTTFSLLKKYLDNSKIESPVLFGAVYGLMSAGHSDATKMVLEWATTREDDISSLLNLVIPLIRDESSNELFKEYATGEKANTFNNEQNQKIFSELYNQYLIDRGYV